MQEFESRLQIFWMANSEALPIKLLKLIVIFLV